MTKKTEGPNWDRVYKRLKDHVLKHGPEKVTWDEVWTMFRQWRDDLGRKPIKCGNPECSSTSHAEGCSVEGALTGTFIPKREWSKFCCVNCRAHAFQLGEKA